MSDPTDPNHGPWNSFGFLTKIRYSGALGKVAAVGIVFFLLLCVVSFAAHGATAILWGVLVLALFALIFVILRMEAIFRSNPEMATLEGKEVIQYRQLEAKSKDHEPFKVIEIASDPKLNHEASSVVLDGKMDSEDHE